MKATNTLTGMPGASESTIPPTAATSANTTETVSYTHLTLPTIYSV